MYDTFPSREFKLIELRIAPTEYRSSTKIPQSTVSPSISVYFDISTRHSINQSVATSTSFLFPSRTLLRQLIYYNRRFRNKTEIVTKKTMLQTHVCASDGTHEFNTPVTKCVLRCGDCPRIP